VIVFQLEPLQKRASSPLYVLVRYWKSKRSFDNLFYEFLVKKIFCCRFQRSITIGGLILDSVFQNVLYLLYVSGSFPCAYIYMILVTKWFNFQTSTFLIWASLWRFSMGYDHSQEVCYVFASVILS